MAEQLQEYAQQIAQEHSLKSTQTLATLQLLEEGATVPFIARYRKEATQGLDEVQIIQVRDRLEQLKELDKRRATILKSLEDQKVLTPELHKKVLLAETLAILEDLYLPYKPKRRTKGSIAKEKGLEPLAQWLWEQQAGNPEEEAQAYIDEEKEVADAEQALSGARDIIAEWINENSEVRAKLRQLFETQSTLTSKVLKGKETEGEKFRDYFEWEEPLSKVPSHRMLAIRRGTQEGILSFRIQPPEDAAIAILDDHFLEGPHPSTDHVKQAIKDAYKRLLSLSLETEVRVSSKKQADADAISVFMANLRELLLAAPMGQKSVLGIDPGLRTGCKIVCLNPQGKLLSNSTIYPLPPQKQEAASEKHLKELVQQYDIDAIAIGNGTGGREVQRFCQKIQFPKPVHVIMVNESGASVYSASEIAREEFPDKDLTVRGAVSIGRRLMDPLAELVKIDPKSIGVGQYQHDVDQNDLQHSLDDVVSSCVNAVGVEVNTASHKLISYVSGLSDRIAKAVVAYRDEHGAFKDRKTFLKVPGMGPKTFEQAAGFLRIHGASNPLDASAVHPERYELVQKILNDANVSIADFHQDTSLQNKIDLKQYVTDTVGLPTLQDILAELVKPGRDPREPFEVFQFEESVNTMEDLKVGMKLPGVVTNVTNFGAFVDIGVHQDGLVHVSHLADRFVSNPQDLIKVHQKVEVTVMEVDTARKRIGLSMKKDPFQESAAPKRPKKKQAPKGNFKDLVQKWGSQQL